MSLDTGEKYGAGNSALTTNGVSIHKSFLCCSAVARTLSAAIRWVTQFQKLIPYQAFDILLTQPSIASLLFSWKA